MPQIFHTLPKSDIIHFGIPFLYIIIEINSCIFIGRWYGIFSGVTPLSEVIKQLSIAVSRSHFTGFPESSIG